MNIPEEIPEQYLKELQEKNIQEQPEKSIKDFFKVSMASRWARWWSIQLDPNAKVLIQVRINGRILKEISEGNPIETFKDSQKKFMEKTWKESSKEFQMKFLNESCMNPRKKKTGNIPERIPGRILGGINGGMPEGTPGEIPKAILRVVAEAIPGRIS